jgi:hypothetical protein
MYKLCIFILLHVLGLLFFLWGGQSLVISFFFFWGSLYTRGRPVTSNYCWWEFFLLFFFVGGGACVFCFAFVDCQLHSGGIEDPTLGANSLGRAVDAYTYKFGLGALSF